MAGRTPRQIEILEAASDESEEASSGSEAADEEPGTAGGAGAAGQGGASAAAAPAAGGGRARRDEAKRGESGVRPKRPPTARARCQMQRPLGRPAHLHFSLAPSQRLFSHRSGGRCSHTCSGGLLAGRPVGAAAAAAASSRERRGAQRGRQRVHHGAAGPDARAGGAPARGRRAGRRHEHGREAQLGGLRDAPLRVRHRPQLAAQPARARGWARLMPRRDGAVRGHALENTYPGGQLRLRRRASAPGARTAPAPPWIPTLTPGAGGGAPDLADGGQVGGDGLLVEGRRDGQRDGQVGRRLA